MRGSYNAREARIRTQYKYTYRWTWAIAAISVGLLSWVLWRAGVAEVRRSVGSADYGLVALGIPIILAGLIFRAIRWRVLLLPLGSPSIAVSFSSMMLGYLGNNLLPMRAGEIVRAYALGQQTSISKSAVLATIVVERVVDGVVMILALSLLFLVFPVPNWLQLAAVGGGVVFSGAVTALILARRRPKWPLDMFRVLLSRLPDRWRLKGISVIDNFFLGLTSFRSSTDALIFLLLTVMVWSAEVLWFWLVMRAFGITLAILPVALVVAAGALSTTIPALPGYIGTYEFVVVNALAVLGVDVGPATAFALGLHGFTWLTVNTVAAICVFQLGVSLRSAYVPNIGPEAVS